MTKKVEKESTETKKDVKLTKEKLERMREVLSGRSKFHSLEQYKRPGYDYRLASTNKGQDLKYAELGYEPVKDSNGKVVTMQGGNGVEQILMEIPKEVREVLKQMREEENAELERSVDPRLRLKEDSSFTEALYDFKDEVVKRRR